VKVFFTIFGILSAVVFYFAESPRFLEDLVVIDTPKKDAPIAVTLKDPLPKEEEPPKEIENSDLEALRPTAYQFSEEVKSFGMAYGSGGAGLAIAGGGGLDSALLSAVQDDASVTRKAQIIQRTNPDYPPDAKSRGINGDVYIKILVEKDGRIGQMKVESSNPPGIFDESVLKAAGLWRFEPAMEKGRPVASWIGQRIRFELE
jgi:TonB family protein